MLKNIDSDDHSLLDDPSLNIDFAAPLNDKSGNDYNLMIPTTDDPSTIPGHSATHIVCLIYWYKKYTYRSKRCELVENLRNKC